MSERKQYLYTIQPSRPEMLSEGTTPAEEAVVGEHFSYLKRLAEGGVVLLAGRTLNTDQSSFGIVIFEAGSDEEARQVMARDPAVEKGVMRAALYPYRVALVGRELAAH